jgi:hypothetical protein
LIKFIEKLIYIYKNKSMHAYEYIHKPLCVSLEGRHEGGVGVGVLRLTAAVGLSAMMRQGLGSGRMHI